jgi:mannose-6-phosphate isomerase-like protein (cupin superfamily)
MSIRSLSAAKAGYVGVGSIAALLALGQAAVMSQSTRPAARAIDISAADIQRVISAPNGGIDRQLHVVDMGKHRVGVGILRRGKTPPGAPPGALSHANVSEVYYIISGSGTLLTGGTVKDVKPVADDSDTVKVLVGPSSSATFVQAAQSRKVGPGDVVIIPPGVYHGFGDIPDHVEYLSVRSDVDHVLPAGYVHPLLSRP